MNGMARMDAMRWLVQAARSQPDSKRIMKDYIDLMVTNWLEPEKLPPPLVAKKTKVRFYGDT